MTESADGDIRQTAESQRKLAVMVSINRHTNGSQMCMNHVLKNVMSYGGTFAHTAVKILK